MATQVSLTPRLIRELGAPDSTLRALVQRCESAIIVYAGGEVDARNDSTWRLLLSEAAADTVHGEVLIVDLAGLTFVSCSAFEVLVEQARWCRCHDVEMRLVSEQPLVRRIVAACELSDALPVHLSVDAALGHGPAHNDVSPDDAGEREPVVAHSAVPAVTLAKSILPRPLEQTSFWITALSGPIKKLTRRSGPAGDSTRRGAALTAQ